MVKFEMKDGVAVVTGAASGMGADLAIGLAKRGAHLALADVDQQRLESFVNDLGNREVRISTHVVDIADRDAAAQLAGEVQETHGGATMLFNNAGVALAGFFDEVSEDRFDWLMQVNFHGPVRLVRAFLPVLEAANQAQIVNISSVGGLVGMPGQTAYTASKFAIRGFSEALRHELAGSTVGVTTVNPGGVDTRIADNAFLAGDQRAAKQRVEEFRKNLKLSSAKAAEIILKGVVRRRGRILVGADARLIDFLQRLMPVSYLKVLSPLFSGVLTRDQARKQV